MPNIASVLRDEISRVSRKEVRSGTSVLQSSSARHRSDIAALKRQVQDLQRQVARLSKLVGSAQPVEAIESDADSRRRFSAKGLASQRARLGLSAAQFGQLIGVSGQSIYKWEQGGARPRAKQMAAIIEVRQMGRRDAARRLGLEAATSE